MNYSRNKYTSSFIHQSRVYDRDDIFFECLYSLSSVIPACYHGLVTKSIFSHALFTWVGSLASACFVRFGHLWAIFTLFWIAFEQTRKAQRWSRTSRSHTSNIAPWCWPRGFGELNRPPPSFKNPHFQNEAKCTTFLDKMSFICMRMKNHFHIKGWALNLVLIQRSGGSRKWPIDQFG